MYSPKIPEEYVRKLYRLKLKTGKKMTVLVKEALNLYFDKFSLDIISLNGGGD